MNKLVLFFLLCAGALFSCTEKQPPPTPPVQVNLYTVKSEMVKYYDKYPATTQALSQVNLLPQVQGYITGIFFKEGSFVKKGQKLYEIDRRLYTQNYDAALANLKVAQGNYDQAKQDADRYTYLNSHNAIAKQVLDHAVIAKQNADNAIKAAEEAVKNARTNLSFSEIYAPFDGQIGFSQVKLGNLVVVGQTILNTISTYQPMAVDFLVNEKQVMDFEKLQKQNAKPIDSLFTLLMPNNTLYPHVGKISVIDRAVDPQTGAIRIRLEFPNPDNDLKVGMSCMVQVHNQESSPQIVIPGKAVVEQMGEYFVFVAKDTVMNNSADPNQKQTNEPTAKGPEYHAFQKKIKLGQTIGGNVIVKLGLNDGERIVVDGVQSLHEGTKIAIGSKATQGDSSKHGK
jgi:membrane fusion protein, multidrug efflux system